MSSTQEKNKGNEKNGNKTFRDRVEEYRMWSDEKAFKELDYERRREDKKKRKGVLKSDKALQRSKKCYIPAILIICAGTFTLLCSSLDSLAEETIFHQHQRVFQILGGILVALGLVILMSTAVYTYHREDAVRSKYGFPSLFESSRVGTTTSAYLEEVLFLQDEFVDSPSVLEEFCNGKLSRMTSYESSTSVGNLGHSFSSTSTTKTWVHKHAHRFQRSTSTIRRLSSDTALDQSFARARLLSWREEAAQEVESTGQTQSLCPGQQQPRPEDSQTYSISSTTSSGYHSLVSSPVVTILTPPSNTDNPLHTTDLRNSQLANENVDLDNCNGTTHLPTSDSPEETNVDSVPDQIFRIVINDTQNEALEEEIIVLPELLSKVSLRQPGEVIVHSQTYT